MYAKATIRVGDNRQENGHDKTRRLDVLLYATTTTFRGSNNASATEVIVVVSRRRRRQPSGSVGQWKVTLSEERSKESGIKYQV
jgi:hypothetical protein